MTTGQKKSDDPIVPEGRRKTVQTAATRRGGMGVTVSKEVVQLELFCGTADSPKGDVRDRKTGQLVRRCRTVPKPRNTTRLTPLAMTMEEVANEDNLLWAFEEVASNRGAAGTDGINIDEVREHLDSVLPKLHSELLDGSYCPGLIRRVWIPKPGGGQRGLGIPNVIDRVVQQAILRVLSPHFERRFHESSHGFRPGRSCHTAIAQAKQIIGDGHEWTVDIDLSKFFDRVHHDRLLSRLEEQGVTDRNLIGLIRRLLKAKVLLPDGVVTSTAEGTPQGGPLSPLLSNIVLDELDWEIDRRGHHFVRYADDCNIYVRSERAGQRVMVSLERYIEGRLRLQINREKSAVARPESRHFLGFRLCRGSAKDTVEVHLSAKARKRINRRVIELTPRSRGQSIELTINRINRYLRPWLGFFKICSRAEARWSLHAIDAHVRRRLRAIIIRQKKRPRYLVRWFQSRRVPGARARCDVYGGSRSAWALSITWSAHRAMGKGYFAKLGLVSLERHWKELQPRPKLIVPTQLTLDLG